MREIIIKLKFTWEDIVVVQIAGLIARRIVTETSEKSGIKSRRENWYD